MNPRCREHRGFLFYILPREDRRGRIREKSQGAKTYSPDFIT